MELTEQLLARSLYGITVISRVQGPPSRFRGPILPSDSPVRSDDLLAAAGHGRLINSRLSERYPSETTPWGFQRDARNDLILFFSGVQHRSQFTNVALGYTQMPSSLNLMPGWNLYVGGFASAVAEQAATQLSGGQNVYLFGHSLGGMIAEAVAERLQQAGKRIASIITYGAPKPAIGTATRATTTQYHVRWMADGDPVPLLPFGNVGDFARFAAVIAPLARNLPRFQPNQWTHAGTGLAISPTAIRQSLEPRGTVNPVTVLSEWMAGQGEEASEHEADHYRLLLQGWWDARLPSTSGRRLPNQPVGTAAPPRLVMPFRIPEAMQYGPDLVIPLDLAGAGRASPVESPIVRRVQPAAGPASVNNAAVNVGASAMANGVLSPNAGFTRAKMPGYGWVIYFRGMMVGAVQSGSRARTFCRKGNTLIRYMNNLAWTPSIGDAWTDAINAYIAGQGYNPPMSPLT